jgi:predicted KAP-like P-loop ATPase
MIEHSDKHMFSADRPINSIREDLLGRGRFAKSLAKAIHNWKGKDSLVIALYGEWGSGKSSLKNMVVDDMQNSGEVIPEIVEFNPWQWASQRGLLAAFFREVGVALGKIDRTPNGKKSSVKWQYYGTVLKAGSIVLEGLLSLVLWLLIISSSLGIGLLVFESNLIRTISTIALSVFLMVSVILKWGGKVSDCLSNLLTYHTAIHSKSLEEIRNDLKLDLEKLKKPILVAIDDIDRLTRDETRIIIQLVKANADFPNITYLLLFQRDIVEKNLTTEQLSGKDYLEKIVQVHFDIPQAEESKIQRVLFSRLDNILENDEKILKNFDKTRWGNIFVGGLSNYFTNLRNVYRYLSSLSFHVSLFKGEIAFEVNPIDLIALEVLRQFETSVYSGIAKNKDIFTNIHRRGERDERDREIIEGIIAQTSDEHKSDVKEIIKQLFPTIEWALGGLNYADVPERWFHELRVCHPNVFSRYFQMTIPERDISQSELEDIISKSNNRNSLKKRFLSMKDRDILDTALNRLDSYKEKIPIENALSFIPALFDIADDLTSEGVGFFALDPHSHASRIIYWYLRQESDPSACSSLRGQILR